MTKQSRLCGLQIPVLLSLASSGQIKALTFDLSRLQGLEGSRVIL